MAAGDVTVSIIDTSTTAAIDTAITTARTSAGSAGKVLVNTLGPQGNQVMITSIEETSTAGMVVDTELPAAAALSDTTANPTTSMVGAAVMGYNGTTWERIKAVAVDGDGASASATGNLRVGGFNLHYNGSSWDRGRNNTFVTLLTSAIRAATNTTSTATNHNGRGVMLFLDITANPGAAETLQVTLNMVDSIGATAVPLAMFAATTAATNEKNVYIIYPGAVETTATANVFVQGIPTPRTYNVTVTHSGAGNWTYSLTSCAIL